MNMTGDFRCKADREKVLRWIADKIVGQYYPVDPDVTLSGSAFEVIDGHMYVSPHVYDSLIDSLIDRGIKPLYQNPADLN